MWVPLPFRAATTKTRRAYRNESPWDVERGNGL
jgi:hypothetical protein